MHAPGLHHGSHASGFRIQFSRTWLGFRIQFSYGWAYFSSTLLRVFQSFFYMQQFADVCTMVEEIEHKQEVTSSLFHGFGD
jgi:hypothetical protein